MACIVGLLRYKIATRMPADNSDAKGNASTWDTNLQVFKFRLSDKFFGYGFTTGSKTPPTPRRNLKMPFPL